MKTAQLVIRYRAYNDKPNRKPVQVHDPMPFDDEENIDDYVFFGISRSK